MANYIRVPVIPTSYDNRHKVQPRELLIDFDTKDIYVASLDDPSILVNITGDIKESIKNLNGDEINITIDGVGVVNLQDLVTKLNGSISSSIKGARTNNNAGYVTKKNVLDGTSLNVFNHNIQINGFRNADDNSIPVKRGGVLKWIPIISNGDSDEEESSMGQIMGGSTSDSNPNDGVSSKCIILDPSDHKLYLRASKKQKTIKPVIDSIKVILPTPLDEKCEIEWMIFTGDTVPALIFPNNVYWNKIQAELTPNSIHVFNFQSWDGGLIWCGKCTRYNTNPAPEIIDEDYIKTNYYDKTDINSLLRWENNEGDNNESSDAK